MTDPKDKADDNVVCEFFGIEITTKNPKLARILTSDVIDVLNTDIKVIPRYQLEDEQKNEDEDDTEILTDVKLKPQA